MQALVVLVLAGIGIWCGKDKDKELRYVEKDFTRDAAEEAIPEESQD